MLGVVDVLGREMIGDAELVDWIDGRLWSADHPTALRPRSCGHGHEREAVRRPLSPGPVLAGPPAWPQTDQPSSPRWTRSPLRRGPI